METDVLVVLISIAGSIAVAVLTALATSRQQERRIRAELRTEFMAEEAVRQLMLDARWTMRSFRQIKGRIGGFDDEELRRILVRAGAVRFEGPEDDELWGLRTRNQEKLDS